MRLHNLYFTAGAALPSRPQQHRPALRAASSDNDGEQEVSQLRAHLRQLETRLSTLEKELQEKKGEFNVLKIL
jgi:hypothetical protein